MTKLFLLTLVVILFSCKSQDHSAADNRYEEFKAETKNDTLNSLAQDDAQFIADFHYDSTKRYEAKTWLSKLKIFSDSMYVDSLKKLIEIKESLDKEDISNRRFEQQFLKRNLKLSKILHSDYGDNFLQEHILLARYTNNKDSLINAIVILIDSIYKEKNVNFYGIYLYKESKDFELNGARNWFVMGSKITNKPVEVRFSGL